MADKDTKIADLKTDDKKKDETTSGIAELDEHYDDEHHEPSASDKVMAEVKPKSDVKAAAEALVEHLMLEVKAVAGESQQTIEELADHFSEKAAEFAEEIAAKVQQANEQRGYDPRGAVDQDKMDADLEKHHDHPHNEAAASAVAHGMEPKIANQMTTISSNS